MSVRKDFKCYRGGAKSSYTIVRPYITYNSERIPLGISPAYKFHKTVLERIKNGKPWFVWDDGKALTTLTYTEDFAVGMVGLFLNEKAKNEKYDVILVDTAGRLQNKFNLMEELKKIKTVIDKQAPEALKESILVIDANTGQNGLQQAKVFSESVNLTCVALTKLDGSAKGAIIIAIAKEMKLPVKLVGVGEKMEDLKAFNPDDFIEALFS